MTKKRSVTLSFLLILSISFFLPVLVVAEGKYGGTLRIGTSLPQFNRLDGRQLTVEGMVPTAPMIYDGIISYGPKGAPTPVPGIVTSFETTDNKVWIFHLRQGVKFHNGREMTAEDVKQNFDWRIKTPEGWRPVKYRELIKGLKKAEVIDKYTVKITLEDPFAPLPGILAWSMRAIVPPEEVDKWGAKFSAHAVGTGPYKLVEIKPREKVVLERFDGYWGPRPYIDRLEFKFYRSDEARLIALQKGEIDFAQLKDGAKPILDKDPNLEWDTVTSSSIIQKHYFNVRRWPMNDIRFRRAVWMGADWKNIIINAYPYKSGVFARTLLDHTPYFNPEAMELVPQYNPEEAKKLIQAVEKDAGKKIPPIFWLDSSSSPMRDIGELAKLSLDQIGVPINLQLMSHAIWFDKLLRDPKMEWDMGGYGQGFLRAPTLGFAYWVTNSRTAPDGKSLGGYSNPEFDRWVKLTETSYDEKERIRATHEAEKILLRDAITIPMFVVHNIYAWNKKLKGVKNTNVGTIQVTTGWGANMWIDE